MLTTRLLHNFFSSHLRGRRGGRALQVVTAVSTGLLPALAGAAPWELKPNVKLPDDDAVTTQKLELVDINVDGFVDIMLANSKGDVTGSQADAELNQVMLNQAGAGFTELAGVFEEADTAWTIKAGDLDNDGDPDLVVGVNFLGASYVLMNDDGAFTRQMLPGMARSIGDLELGDVDGDGDLDIFAADWGIKQPYGDPDDDGGPMVLWLGDGAGNFAEANANLPMGMSALSSWTFDVELVDFDNDFDVDAFVSNRGGGKALVFRNDGAGTFELYPFPSLQPMNGKNVNVAFTPMDLNGDGFVDLVTLQDGPGDAACEILEGKKICAKRNAVLINDTKGQATDATQMFWDPGSNPPKLDFDAATLDFDNNGTPDLVLTGLRLGSMDANSRLLLNSGTKLKSAAAPNDIALPVVPALGRTFGLMFADFDRDRREDIAVVTRDPEQPSFALFGRAHPTEGVPEDVTGPKLAPFEMLPGLLYFGKEVSGRARAHDSKTPSHWHDYLFDDQIGTYNLTGPGDVAAVHRRRIPYMEFALGLDDPDEIKALADSDPQKYIAPGIWYGEALWKVRFNVPYNNKKDDTLTWQWCAIDAAGNKSCLGPFQVQVIVPDGACGDGKVDPWETCDDPTDPLCVQCESTCGDGVCEWPTEDGENCPTDCPCDGDRMCESPEMSPWCKDCGAQCGDGVCEPPENPTTCPGDCPPCDLDGVCEPGEDATCPDCEDPTTTDPTGPLPDPCGDLVCASPTETVSNCSLDCQCNGDGVCDPWEDESCLDDNCGDEASDTDCDSAGAVGQCALDDDGCGCVSTPTGTRGLWASLLLLGAFGVRRSRKRV